MILIVVHNLSPSLIARYFYFECPRYLRYFATPKEERRPLGIPETEFDFSLTSKQLTETGHLWEESVVSGPLAGRVFIPPGEQPVYKRSHTTEATLGYLRGARPEAYIYQPVLNPPRSFLDRFGLDPTVCTFPQCRPDLFERTDDGTVRVIDVKASEAMKGSHRVQVALYTLVLEEVGRNQALPIRVDTDHGGVWLQQRTVAETFDLGASLRLVTDFLRYALPSILTKPIGDVGWHLNYRCEWCDFFEHCQAQAHAEHSVSLIPYLSVCGRQYLHHADWQGGTPIETCADMAAFLARPDSAAALNRCGSLRHQHDRLQAAIAALDSGSIEPLGGSTIGFPMYEDVRIVLTLQQDPVSGLLYAAGFTRLGGGPTSRKGSVYSSNSADFVTVAETAEDAGEVLTRFLEALHAELRPLDDYNRGREWGDQLTLQTYVFDNQELSLLNEYLYLAVAYPPLAPVALELLFHFQDTSLATTDDQPVTQIPYPVVVLTRALRELVALPVPVSYRLPEVLNALGSTYTITPSDFFWLPLSNIMKGDPVLHLWSGRHPEYREAIERELRTRLLGASYVVTGLRARIGDRLTTYPRRFLFPAGHALTHPVLSRLVFITRYECFLAALAVRTSRCRPYDERVAQGISIPLRLGSGEYWHVEPPLDPHIFERTIQRNLKAMVVPAGEEGEVAQMRYDDYERRSRPYVPKNVAMWLVSTDEIDLLRNGAGLIVGLRIRLPYGKDQQRLVRDDQAVLHPVFSDWNSDRIVGSLIDWDSRPDALLLALVENLKTLQGPPDDEPAVVAGAAALIDASKLKPSQREAAKGALQNRLTLVWGPPGTGKTHSLAAFLVAYARACLDAHTQVRVMVTAFTHAAVENLLAKVIEVAGDRFKPGQVLIGKVNEVRRDHAIPVVSDADLTLGTDRETPVVILGTTVYQFFKLHERVPPFDILIVDEASQMKFGELSLPLWLLKAGGRLVLAGDDFQLPPIIQGEYPGDGDLPGLHDSVFRYLRYRDDPERPFTRELKENFRMNATLCRFPAEELYGVEYGPATREIAQQRLDLSLEGLDEWKRFVLDPAYPLGLIVLEDVRATTENVVEARLTAELATELRDRVRAENGRLLPVTKRGDATFWDRELVIISPHHAQIQAITAALRDQRDWQHPPFVDTVDKIQGGERETVLVSYGVSDSETALAEAGFIFSRNRLNVSITRAKKKCVVFLPRPLLHPSYAVLENEDAADGLRFMLGLQEFLERNGEVKRFSVEVAGERVTFTALRAAVDADDDCLSRVPDQSSHWR